MLDVINYILISWHPMDAGESGEFVFMCFVFLIAINFSFRAERLHAPCPVFFFLL